MARASTGRDVRAGGFRARSELPAPLSGGVSLVAPARLEPTGRGCPGLGAVPGDPGGLRLLAGCLVRVDRAAGGCLVEPADERGVLLCDLRGVTFGRSLRESALEGPGGRTPAQVLEPLAGGPMDAAFLLLDVRHREEPVDNGPADASRGGATLRRGGSASSRG